jgi:hypothetical protein
MAAAPDFFEARSAIHDHDPQPAGVRIQFLFIKDDTSGQLTTLAPFGTRHRWHHIELGQFMVATNDLLKPVPSAHDLHDEAARVGMPFTFIDEISLFDPHDRPAFL